MQSDHNLLLFWILNSHYPSYTVRIMTCPLLCQLLCCSQWHRSRSGELVTYAVTPIFEWLFWRKGRTGKENLTQASWNPLYFVTLWIRHQVIGPPFPTILIPPGLGGHGPRPPPRLRQSNTASQRKLTYTSTYPHQVQYLKRSTI